MLPEIQPLPKEQWQGYILPIRYAAAAVYDVRIDRTASGYVIGIEKAALDKPVLHTPEDYDFPDCLYAAHWPEARAWGAVQDGGLLAAIETCPEEWSNRLRITELWVDAAYQKRGLGHALLEIAKKQAIEEKRRAILLETQSCNVNAIGFYQHEGFTLIGFDACCYSNEDLCRREVRLEFGWFPEETKSR